MLGPVDIIALGLIALACLRGIYIGLTREVFSIGAIAAATLAVRFLLEPARELVLESVPYELPATLSTWIAGGVLVIACMLGVSLLGRLLQRGVNAAGLGAIDRLGGATLGLAEGGLVVALGVAVGLATLGNDHNLLEKSHTLTYYKKAQAIVQPRLESAIDVAAPPPIKADR
ncbi:MAG: CvpA family protein [Deltaproteobacteria bacterium]|nr:CvpA family protein [Deltaproteobacteria bacterium]